MEIDVYKGNENIFLVLTGFGGSTKGYQNKYVTIANNVKQKFGFTVFVVASEAGMLNNEKDYFDKIMKEICFYTTMLKINVNKIYAMGTSAGANLLLHNAHRYKKFEKVLAINCLLNVNYNLFCDFIKEYNGKTTLIVGELDDSFFFLNRLKKFESGKFSVASIPFADHNFTNMLDEYIKLPENLLFK